MRELKFIHISKTAGSSIENAGLKIGLKWGRFHEEYRYYKHFHRKKNLYTFHLPFSLVKKEIKNKYSWFTVVRNPYSRILSEYYCKFIPPKFKNKEKFSKNMFNLIVQKHIKERETQKAKLDFHYTEQYKYIDLNYDIKILKFEELPFCFNNLMKLFNIDLSLPKYKSNASKKNKTFSISDFNQQTIKLINEVYKKDFEMFQYKIL